MQEGKRKESRGGGGGKAGLKRSGRSLKKRKGVIGGKTEGLGGTGWMEEERLEKNKEGEDGEEERGGERRLWSILTSNTRG